MVYYRRSRILRQAQAWVFILLVATIVCFGVTELRCPACPPLEVSRVIDGDTFDSPAGRVRLFGVDTPERGQRCFQAATARLRQLAGTTVRVETGPRETDRYGRLLYYVYTADGASIDVELVRDGLDPRRPAPGSLNATGARSEGKACRVPLVGHLATTSS
ncbi:MAG: thermonuclease family protein [Chloroflexi bacterium]|nr:thermonuclease family protein [Chloroflexota bacterium]MCI0799959.1 thermonuclease family protein [Chloroflexota bacterium]MCI0825589.1 thermonuclease family protein [Chloroflexota bacterium]